MPKVNIADPEISWDADDPEGFRVGMFRPGPGLGAAGPSKFAVRDTAGAVDLSVSLGGG